MRLQIALATALAPLALAAPADAAVISPQTPPYIDGNDLVVGGDVALMSPAMYNPGTAGGPILESIQWQRCAPANVCVDIPGAVNPFPGSSQGYSYTPTTDDGGKELRLKIVGTDATGSVTQYSNTVAIDWVAPVVVDAPATPSSATVGDALTATAPVFHYATSVTYQWLRCTLGGRRDDGCTAIPGATALGYTPVAADAGTSLVLEATADNPYAGVVTSRSAGTDAVEVPAPVAASAPTIPAVTPTVGQALTGTAAVFTGIGPIALTHQWKRCPAGPIRAVANACTAIPGATSLTYTPTADDVGTQLVLEATADNAAPGVERTQSQRTAVVVAAPVAPVVPPVAPVVPPAAPETPATTTLPAPPAPAAPAAPAEAVVPAAPRAATPVAKPRTTAMKLTVGTGEAKVTSDTRAAATRTLTVGRSGAVPVTCDSDADLRSCTVSVRANIGGRWVVIGSADRAGAVELTARGEQLVARSGGGLLVRVEARGTTQAGDVRVSQVSVRLAPKALQRTFAHFATDSVALSRATRRSLDRLARDLRAAPARAISVVGHTDTSGAASDAYRERLGRRRAAAVVRYLEARGVRATFTTGTRAQTDPSRPNTTPAGKAANRRVVITVTR